MTQKHSGRSSRFERMVLRERAGDRYWTKEDHLGELRCWWRAQTVRHTFHVLPGETFLELGAGSGMLTRPLARATRGECPITAVTFGPDLKINASEPSSVTPINLADFPGELSGKTFDYVVGTNLLDSDNAAAVLGEVQKFLKPGGRLLLFESNPWNLLFRLRRMLANLFPPLRRGDERRIPNRPQLYELLSELGYIRVSAIPYDFLYRPIPRWPLGIVRNLSLILENAPLLRSFAGTILVHAQLPPKDLPRPPVKMTEHENLHRKISIVIPCHNEEMNVEPLYRSLLQHYDDYVHEIVLVDDNSTDGTREVLARLASADSRVKPIIRQPPNGVGRALSDGMKAATGDYILLMDCDFTQILPELRDMFDAAAAGADVVLGSRFSRESVLINYPIQKILCNRSFHLLASLLFFRRLRDFTNNLKLLRREVVRNLDLQAAWFAANAETGLKPLLMGYDVRSVPISWINRTPDMGQSSFSLVTNGLGYARVLLDLVWRTRFGFKTLPRRSDETAPAPGTVERRKD